MRLGEVIIFKSSRSCISGKLLMIFVIRKEWNSKSATLMRGIMQRVCSGEDKGKWIPENVRDELDKYWETENYKIRREKAKMNRSSSTGGSVHIGGSIPTTEIRKRTEEKEGRSLNNFELFLLTHQRKDMGEFVDSRLAEIATKFYELKEIVSTQSSPENDSIFFEAVGRMSKRDVCTDLALRDVVYIVHLQLACTMDFEMSRSYRRK